MRKILFSLCLTLLATSLWAVPAKRGIYRTLRLTDGTEVRAQLMGDEHMHFYRADDGTCYAANGDGTFSVTDLSRQRANMERRRAPLNRRLGQQFSRRMKAAMSRTQKALSNPGLSDGFYGQKKGLIILVQFSDLKFTADDNLEFYKKLANQENYTEGDFRGSVHDYFTAQSNGQFDLTFDVVGPVTMPKGYAYYGQNGYNGDDLHVGEMVAEACQAIKDQVDWSQYDWDGDGEADQVFCLYAGHGEADYGEGEGGDDYIWPHMYYLSEGDYGRRLNMNGTYVDTYACSNELSYYDTPDGIGTICHEFSHCLGFPDVYDTTYQGGYGMGYYWDLMDGGNQNGDSYCPAGYSGYEKWVAGWITPTELTENTQITDWKSCDKYGETYIIYNDGNRNEFYIIDNRQKSGWDAELPGNGLLVTHIDYDKNAWGQNTLNDVKSHQRWSIIAADNSYGTFKNSTSYNQFMKNLAGDTYPYNTTNSLSRTSTPRNSVFNANTDGSKYMNKAITDITQNGDGTMSFNFKLEQTQTEPSEKPEGAVFYESFDQCNGDGGNDGIWSGITTITTLTADNDGWSDANNKAYGANACARFGTSDTWANVTSPSFTLTGDATLTFKAGAWKKNGGTLSIYYNDKLIATKTFSAEQWYDISVDFTATGTGSLRFTGIKRLFLDEVAVSPAVSAGISSVSTSDSANADRRIFTIDGRYAGTDKDALPKGIYIVGGKKFAK